MHVSISRAAVLGMALSGFAIVTSASAAPAQAAASCAAPGATHPETAEGAACRLADELEKAFVYPERGKAYAEALRRNVSSGRYAAMSDEAAAEAMTADLQAVAPDGHLRVGRMPRQQPGVRGPGPDFPLLEQGGWIAPGIAFLRINAFYAEPEQTTAVAKFMADHADAKAMIFDLRTHRGGGLDQMDVIFPWLFAKETRLVTMAMRRSVEEGASDTFR